MKNKPNKKFQPTDTKEKQKQPASEVSSAPSKRSFVRGNFLFSGNTQTGIIQTAPKIENNEQGFESIKKDEAIKHKEGNLPRKKDKHKTSKQPALIAIRQTPIEPLPQPVYVNNKCQRATQQQFEYFQTFITQKQKEKQFEDAQSKQVLEFQREQQRFREQRDKSQSSPGINIVIEKDDSVGVKKKKNKIKVFISKKKEFAEGEPTKKNSANIELKENVYPEGEEFE